MGSKTLHLVVQPPKPVPLSAGQYKFRNTHFSFRDQQFPVEVHTLKPEIIWFSLSQTAAVLASANVYIQLYGCIISRVEVSALSLCEPWVVLRHLHTARGQPNAALSSAITWSVSQLLQIHLLARHPSPKPLASSRASPWVILGKRHKR